MKGTHRATSEIMFKECRLCCDKELLSPNTPKCYELRKSHLSCLDCLARDDRGQR